MVIHSLMLVLLLFWVLSHDFQSHLYYFHEYSTIFHETNDYREEHCK
jgi:hypothetical protein